jgi:hypothetical protein
VAGKDDGPLAKPGEDPYHIEWPDDAKEMRAVEREKRAQRAMVRPAPRYLTAIVLGVNVMLAFLLAIAVALGNIGLLPFLGLPVIVIAVLLGFPVWAILERVSRGWRSGFPELAFLVVGFAIGLLWTHAVVNIISNVFAVFEDDSDAAFFRTVAGLFMGTATASAFMAAKFWTDRLRFKPRFVYALAVGVALIAALGVLTWTVSRLPGT